MTYAQRLVAALPKHRPKRSSNLYSLYVQCIVTLHRKLSVARPNRAVVVVVDACFLLISGVSGVQTVAEELQGRN